MNIGIGVNQQAGLLLSPSNHLVIPLASSRFSPTSIMSSIDSPDEGRQSKSRRTLSTQDVTSSLSSQSSVSSSLSSSSSIPSSLAAVARAASPAENSTSLQRTKMFVPLARPDDSLWLAPPVCLVRQQIEVVAFPPQAIQALDKPSFSRGGRLDRILARHGHVVGVRCGWCAHLPMKSRARGAISFPESISVLHQTIRNFKRYHFNGCTCMPNDITEKMRKFDEKPKAHQSRKGSETYWLQSARELGLVDCGGEDKGIRFHQDVLKARQEEAIAKKETGIVDEEGLSSNKKRYEAAPEINSASSPCHDMDMLSMLAAVAQTTSKANSSYSSDANNAGAKNSSLPFRKRKLSLASIKKTAAKQA